MSGCLTWRCGDNYLGPKTVAFDYLDGLIPSLRGTDVPALGVGFDEVELLEALEHPIDGTIGEPKALGQFLLAGITPARNGAVNARELVNGVVGKDVFVEVETQVLSGGMEHQGIAGVLPSHAGLAGASSAYTAAKCLPYPRSINSLHGFSVRF